MAFRNESLVSDLAKIAGISKDNARTFLIIANTMDIRNGKLLLRFNSNGRDGLESLGVDFNREL